MGRPDNTYDIKYVRLNKSNFEDRLVNNDGGLLVYANDTFRKAYYYLDDTICFEDSTTVSVEDLYADMENGDAEIYAVIGECKDDEDNIPMVVSYEDIVDKIIEDDYSDEEY